MYTVYMLVYLKCRHIPSSRQLKQVKPPITKRRPGHVKGKVGGPQAFELVMAHFPGKDVKNPWFPVQKMTYKSANDGF